MAHMSLFGNTYKKCKSIPCVVTCVNSMNLGIENIYYQCDNNQEAG